MKFSLNIYTLHATKVSEPESLGPFPILFPSHLSQKLKYV